MTDHAAKASVLAKPHTAGGARDLLLHGVFFETCTVAPDGAISYKACAG